MSGSAVFTRRESGVASRKLINEYVSASSLSDSMKVNDERGAVVMSTFIFTTPG